MSKLILSYFTTVFLLVLGCGKGPVATGTLPDFILPKSNSTYVYTMSKGGVLYSRVLSVGKDRVQLEDTFELPSELVPPEAQIVTDKYTLLISGNSVVRQDKRGAAILLKKPLQALTSKWEGRITSFSDNQREERKAECQITKVDQQIVLGQNRETITVDCIDNTPTFETLWRLRFANGLGVIEKSIHSSPKSQTDGQSFSWAQEITLKEIKSDFPKP